MTRIYNEWADGWHRADAEDDGLHGPRPHPDWPAEVQRGYGDWWTHPQGHERRVGEVDHRAHRGEALLPDPPLRPRGIL